jgi:hypothetical protein
MYIVFIFGNILIYIYGIIINVAVNAGTAIIHDITSLIVA